MVRVAYFVVSLSTLVDAVRVGAAPKCSHCGSSSTATPRSSGFSDCSDGPPENSSDAGTDVSHSRATWSNRVDVTSRSPPPSLSSEVPEISALQQLRRDLLAGLTQNVSEEQKMELVEFGNRIANLEGFMREHVVPVRDRVGAVIDALNEFESSCVPADSKSQWTLNQACDLSVHSKQQCMESLSRMTADDLVREYLEASRKAMAAGKKELVQEYLVARRAHLARELDSVLRQVDDFLRRVDEVLPSECQVARHLRSWATETFDYTAQRSRPYLHGCR